MDLKFFLNCGRDGEEKKEEREEGEGGERLEERKHRGKNGRLVMQEWENGIFKRSKSSKVYKG